MNNLSLDFIPMETLRAASPEDRVEMILERIKDKKIVVLNSKFDPKEEATLIQRTMEIVNKSFTGVEICSLSSNELTGNTNWLARIKEAIINLITGSKTGITVIGPAKIIREIKREPDRISLLIK